jgi:hypothetical protein
MINCLSRVIRLVSRQAHTPRNWQGDDSMNRDTPTLETRYARAIRRTPSGALDHEVYEREARRLRRAALSHLVGALAARLRAVLRGIVNRRARPDAAGTSLPLISTCNQDCACHTLT